MTTVITKNSSTASAVPASGDLVQGELAVNVTDKKIFTKDGSGTVVKVVGQLGNQEPSAVAITGGTIAGVAQTGGTINNTPIGATTAAAITGTLITANTGFSGPLTGAVTGNTTGTHTGAVVGNVTGNLTGNVTASSGSSTFNNVTINGTLDMDASSAATITNLPSPTNSGDAANKGYVDTQISNLVASAPSTLDTLNELAAALGNDASFSTTVTTSIAAKLPKSGGTMTGDIAMGTNKVTGLGAPTAGNDATTKTYVDTADNLKLNLSGGTMSGAIAMGTNKITGLGTPTAGTDATTKTYVDGILGSATAAATSAAAAATSETNAANSASAASTSASNASASASAAAASYDSFDDRYLGPKSAAPTLDNDGNALLTGALYWNTTSSDLWLWTGSAWTRSALSGTDYVAKTGDTMTGALNIAVSTSSNALRITQEGTGDVIVVEDSTSPDSSPFIVKTDGKVGVGTTSPSTVFNVVDANVAGNDNLGNVYIRTTDSYAADVGGKLTLGGFYNGSSHFAFGGVAGRKENSTISNVAGYLQFLTCTSGGALTERGRFDSAGNFVLKTGSLQQVKTAIAASAIDMSLGNFFSKTISGTTTFTVSNVPSTGTAASFVLDLTNGGSATITWWSGVKWAGGTAPTLTSAGRDVLGFFTHDGGTTWTGLVLGKDVK